MSLQVQQGQGAQLLWLWSLPRSQKSKKSLSSQVWGRWGRCAGPTRSSVCLGDLLETPGVPAGPEPVLPCLLPFKASLSFSLMEELSSTTPTTSAASTPAVGRSGKSPLCECLAGGMGMGHSCPSCPAWFRVCQAARDLFWISPSLPQV